jgi:hypothetical protein
MKTWIAGDNGNRASIERWGTEENAREALASLSRCSNCSNCSNCSDCSNCSNCSNCSDCSGCSNCSDCSRCYDCSGCSGCYDCSRCYDCSGCSDCSGCYDCSRCYDCSDCSGCYDCYDCSDCSGCYDCYDCYDCYENRGILSELPTVPVFADIHKAIYAAASQPNALDMESFHTCETTHCRAGWAVHLAGDEGYALENATSPVFAAMQIYKASGYEISPVRFFESNEQAMADMKRLAEQEAN